MYNRSSEKNLNAILSFKNDVCEVLGHKTHTGTNLHNVIFKYS